jgi:hypothetical protein
MVFALPEEGGVANVVVTVGVSFETCRKKFALDVALAPSITSMV